MITAQGAVPDAPSLVPAQPGPGSSSVTSDATREVLEGGLAAFTGSPLFGQVQTLSSLAGVGVVVFVAFYVIRSLTGGLVFDAVKTGIAGAIIAAMLFNLKAPIAFAAGLTGFVESVLQFLIETLGQAG